MLVHHVLVFLFFIFVADVVYHDWRWLPLPAATKASCTSTCTPRSRYGLATTIWGPHWGETLARWTTPLCGAPSDLALCGGILWPNELPG
jgi:hypothetical protein